MRLDIVFDLQRPGNPGAFCFGPLGLSVVSLASRPQRERLKSHTFQYATVPVSPSCGSSGSVARTLTDAARHAPWRTLCTAATRSISRKGLRWPYDGRPAFSL